MSTETSTAPPQNIKKTGLSPNQRLMEWVLAALAVGWLLKWHGIFFRPDYFLPRDNCIFMYPYFAYAADYIRQLHSFPAWLYNSSGGAWIEIFANNCLLLMPHRLLGAAAGAFTELPLNFIYKVSFLIVGQGIFLSGLYFLGRRLLRGLEPALLVFLTFLSVGTGMLHQEQVLGTLFYLPFIWLAALKAREDESFIIAAGALAGLALNNHYPQLLLIYGLGMVLCGYFLIEGAKPLLSAFVKKVRLRTWGLALSAMLICAAPLIYSCARYYGRLDSPIRKERRFSSRSYAEYLGMNREKLASLAPANFILYAGARHSPARIETCDGNILFATCALPLVLILSCWLPFPLKKFQLGAIAFLGLCGIGIFGPLPRLFFHVLPGMKMFRQWYHFLPLLTLHLLVLVLLVLRGFENTPWRAIAGRAGILAGTALLVTATPWLAWPFTVCAGIAVGLKFFIEKKLLNPGFLKAFALCWLIGGSIWWAGPKWQAITDVMAIATDSYVIHKNGNPIQLIMLSLYAPNIATIRDYDAKDTETIFGADGICLLEANRRGRKLDPREYSVTAARNGFSVHLTAPPPPDSSLVFMQCNDGGWRAADLAGQTLPIANTPAKPGRISNFIQIPLKAGQTVTIQRKLSPWHLMITLMWLPPLFWLALRVRKKTRLR
ncbi:MAG: hypothetical protein PHW69_07955 [Elusimicrobiaceae bacterium]|nr:hypothetical protein [Elusimicrobiaceae bacterium]